MSYEQRNNSDYNRGGGGGNYRKVNEGNNGGLTINRTFNNNGGGRYNNDNRGGNYNNDNRGSYNNDNRGNYNNDNRGNYNNDNRGNYSGRGGRGGRGNFNNNRYPQGGRGGDGRGDAQKKLPGNMMPRKEEPVPSSVLLAQQIMTRLGDFSAMTEQDDLYSNIKALAQTFITVGDLKEHPAEISDLFVKCLSQLSVQVPILTSLLALMHLQEPAFASAVVERLQQRYLQAVAEDDVPTAKLLLRSVACLTACGTFEVVGGGGLVEVLEGLLLELNKDLAGQTDGSAALVLSASAQASAYLLATTLVWAAPALQQAQQGAVLEACGAALHRVKAQYRSPFAVGGLQAVFSTYSVAEPEDSMEEDSGAVSAADRVLSVGPAAAGETVLADNSTWDALWESCNQACEVIAAVQAAAEKGEAYAYPAYMNAHWVALFAEQALSPAETKLSFTNFASDWTVAVAGLGRKSAHCTPAGALTTSIGSAAASTWCRLRLTIFDNETSADCASACALSAQAKYHAFSYLEDVFTFFDPVINEDGTKLGSMELLTTHLLAVFKLFPAGAHLEYVLVEMLMQVLLQRPVNSALSASVFRLLLELCRRAPQTFPPVVALGTNTVFQLVPDLDSGSALEFGRWFAFHLLSTQLSWPAHYWDFWVAELAEALDAGQHAVPLFIRYVIEKLSYAAIPDKIRGALPPALHSYIPVIAKPHCALFSTDGASGMLSHIPNIAAVAAQLRDQVDKKADPEDLSDWLDSALAGAEGEHTSSTTGAPLCVRGCLLLQVLVHCGSATPALSALVGLLDRYSEALLTHASTAEHHVDLMLQLAECYGDNSFMYHYLLEEMLRRGQIGVTAAARVLCDADSTGGSAREWGPNPCLYSCVESLLDRTQDFVKAAVAQRSQLGGDLCLDATMDLTPAAAPEGESSAKRSTRDEGAMEGSDNGDADADEGEGHRKRRRADSADENNNNNSSEQQGHDQTDKQDSARMEGTDEADADADKPVDTLWAADEALKSAVRDSRAVYATVTAALGRSVVQGHQQSAQQQDDEEVAVDASSVIAASLLRRTLRVFHGTERHIAHTHSLQEVVLTAAPAQVQAQLQQLSRQGGIDTSRWLSQLGSR